MSPESTRRHSSTPTWSVCCLRQDHATATQHQTKKVERMECLIKHPIDNILNAVEDLQEMGELAAQPFTPK